MKGSNPQYKNIVGAPFKIGLLVKIVQIVDETESKKMIGKQGIIIYYEYDCGCGQRYPDMPMIGVRIGHKIKEFWPEELITIQKRRAMKTNLQN